MTHTMKTPIKTKAIAASVGVENLRFSQIASIAHEHGMMQSFAICKSTSQVHWACQTHRGSFALLLCSTDVAILNPEYDYP